MNTHLAEDSPKSFDKYENCFPTEDAKKRHHRGKYKNPKDINFINNEFNTEDVASFSLEDSKESSRDIPFYREKESKMTMLINSIKF